MFENIIAHINQYAPLNAGEEKILTSGLSCITVKKKEHILKAGEVCTANYFVNKGCFRAYVINDKGVEQVVQFAIENWWITEYMSLNSGRPSEFYIQAVEDSELVVIDKKNQEELFGRLPQLERYFRIVLEKAYTASLMRIHYIFSFSGEELYNHFNTNFPGFVQRVPQYMLASYLGFTPEFLSKLRAKK